MSSFRERNDRNSGKSKSFDRSSKSPGAAGSGPRGPQDGRHGPRHGGPDPSDQWIWGWHAVEAALLNPARPAPKKIYATEERAKQIAALRGADGRPLGIDLLVEIEPNGDIARHLPPGASHQGVAVRTPPLEPVDIDLFCESPGGVLVMLDQVTDPQNVGAILRSAAAFGARGVIMQDRRSPPLAGALAQAAAGALEKIPCATVTNLSRTLDSLAEAGWRAIGLAGESQTNLDEALDGEPTVLVLGSEGEGLRRLVSERCDLLARIPMPGGFESLNVSSAAAIALYAAAVQNRAKGE